MLRYASLSNPNRRKFLQSLSAGVIGHGLVDLLALEASGRIVGQPERRAKQVLVVYEEGGISQMDTWDPKPHGPVEHRTPYKPIATCVPGVQFSSLMPMIARHADKLAVVRSMTSSKAPSQPSERLQRVLQRLPLQRAARLSRHRIGRRAHSGHGLPAVAGVHLLPRNQHAECCQQHGFSPGQPGTMETRHEELGRESCRS